MSGDVYFASDDLLEYTRPVSLEGETEQKTLTLRGVVRGFEVEENGKVSVWLYEGAMVSEPESIQLELDDEGEPVKKDARTYDTPKHPDLIALGLDYLLSLEPEVVRRGNSPREMTNFMVGGDSND